MATKKYDTSGYDNLYKTYAASVDKNLAAQKQAAQTAANSQLKQAYISRVQNENKLAENMARAGIRGGATETSMLNLSNEYGRTRGSINSSLADSIREYDLAADQNKLAYKQDVDAKKLAYVENRQAEDRANAREDQLRLEEEKKTQNRERWTAQYGSVYDLNKLRGALKKATDPVHKTIIMARISYLSDKNNEVAYKQSQSATKKAKKKKK